jgi:CBS domain-containing protein
MDVVMARSRFGPATQSIAGQESGVTEEKPPNDVFACYLPLSPCPARRRLRCLENNDNTRVTAMKTVAQLLKLKDQKNQEVHQIKPGHMVLEALMKMAEKNVGALLVVEDDKVVGIISERDYARKLVLHGRSSVGTPVRDIMVKDVITVDTHQTVDTCLGIMSDKRLRHLPVVENGKLIGLLSIGDLVKEAIAEQAELIAAGAVHSRGISPRSGASPGSSYENV